MPLRSPGENGTQSGVAWRRRQSQRRGARLASSLLAGALGSIDMTRNRFMVGLIFLVFFVISLLSNILGPIVPDIIRTFSASLGAAGLLVFAFFIAYGVMSIPAGFLVERYSEKPVMICAFAGAMLGSIGFALHPTYRVAFASLF